jgi:carbon-monoxide dehydrogenase medium subunit/2-furoyl-CoA dehydrogenase FAD binding subunit
MKPPVFEYYVSTKVDETLKMLHVLVQDQGRDVKLLAGGQSLIPLLNMRLARPEVIIDLNPLEHQFSYIHKDNDVLRIGALTRYHLLASHLEIKQYIPVLSEAISLIGHTAILSRGTIGGSLVHADPAAELPLIFITLGGTITLRSLEGSRSLDAAQFFQRHGDFALVAAAAQVTLDDHLLLRSIRLGIGGAGPTPIDCSHLLTPLLGSNLSAENLREALHDIAKDLDPPDDIHATAEYRSLLAETLAYRALDHSIQKAKAAVLGAL